MDVLVRVKHPLEVGRVNQLVQIHLKGLGARLAEILLTHIRVLQDSHVVPYNQHDVGGSLHNQVGHGFRLLMHERDAHAHLCLVLEYGNGLLTAGGITAGAAVQFVFRLKLVGHAQDFTYLLFRGL